MMTGTVRFFHSEEGVGSITPSRGGIDTHVYMAAVRIAGWETLHRDQQLRYDLAIDRHGRMSAINLELA